MTASVETSSYAGDLTLGDILNASGVDLSEVVVVRHTFSAGRLETAADLTPEKVLETTRRNIAISDITEADRAARADLA